MCGRIVGRVRGWRTWLARSAGGCLFGAAIAERRWWWVAMAVVLAYGLAWLAHLFVEHNMPATFEHPLFSWWADQRMVFLMVTGQMGKEGEALRQLPAWD